MKKLITLTLFLTALAIVVIAGAAKATPQPKVFVCKYVGTPNVDERLQTGQNPISVSQNAIPDFQGVYSYFADAQGRSYVVAFDTGQDEPTCPEPKNEIPKEDPTGCPYGDSIPLDDPKCVAPKETPKETPEVPEPTYELWGK